MGDASVPQLVVSDSDRSSKKSASSLRNTSFHFCQLQRCLNKPALLKINYHDVRGMGSDNLPHMELSQRRIESRFFACKVATMLLTMLMDRMKFLFEFHGADTVNRMKIAT